MWWKSWDAFWAMGGQAFYVWMSFGALFAALAVEAVLLRARRAKALAGIEEERELEAEN